jgi:hypothetical protein
LEFFLGLLVAVVANEKDAVEFMGEFSLKLGIFYISNDYE